MAVESATSAAYPPLVHFLFAIHYLLVSEGASLTKEIFFVLLERAFDSDDYKGAVLRIIRALCTKLSVSIQELVKWMKDVDLKPPQQLHYQASGGRRNTSHSGGGAGASTASSLEAFREKRFGISGGVGGPGASGTGTGGLAAMADEDEDEEEDEEEEEEEERH